jgi:oligopeptide transport system substrate-binding protein
MRFAWIAGAMIAATAATSASADVTYPRGLVRAPETLDPQKAATFNETPLLYDLYEGLVALDAGGRPVPGAAESWTISPDGLVYSFVLRKGARWSNGDVVKAADFVASFRRLFTPATGATEAGPLLIIKNAATVQQGTAKPDALGVVAVDADTLEITLERPAPTFLRRLTLPVALPVNVAAIKKLGADFGTTGKIVSNGAYRLAAIDKKDGYILVKNARFRDAKAIPIDSVVYKPFESPADCVDAFRAKAVLSCPDVPTDQLPALREEFGTALHLAPYPGTYYYAFNTTKKPFDNIVVRRALAMAIDREALAAAVWSGGMMPTDTLVPPVLSGEPATPPVPIAARRADAIKLLAAAGFAPAAEEPEPAKAEPAEPAKSNAPEAPTSDAGKAAEAKPAEGKPADAAPANGKPADPKPTEAKPAPKKTEAAGPQPLRLTIRVGTGMGHEETARAIAEQWKTIGVEASIVTEQNQAHFARLRDGGDFDVARTGWIADETDPIDMLTVLRSDNVRFNYPRYRNTAYDALLDKATTEMDMEKRRQELNSAAALLEADAPVIPLLGYVSLSLIAPTLSGWADNPQNIHQTRFMAVN